MERKTIQINESTIADITLRKGEAVVVITDSTGRHETTVQLGSAESAVLSMLFGDTAAIGFGGTDSWGRNRLPLNLGYENGSVMTDSVMVDNITVQQAAGDGNWCRCELINNGAAVQYTALSDNPSTQPRTAYFTHHTTDTTIKRGFNEGRKALSAWTVTVIQAGNPNGFVEPEPSDIPTTDDM